MTTFMVADDLWGGWFVQVVGQAAKHLSALAADPVFGPLDALRLTSVRDARLQHFAAAHFAQAPAVTSSSLSRPDLGRFVEEHFGGPLGSDAAPDVYAFQSRCRPPAVATAAALEAHPTSKVRLGPATLGQAGDAGTNRGGGGLVVAIELLGHRPLTEPPTAAPALAADASAAVGAGLGAGSANGLVAVAGEAMPTAKAKGEGTAAQPPTKRTRTD
jgi:hypothetical protein